MSRTILVENSRSDPISAPDPSCSHPIAQKPGKRLTVWGTPYCRTLFSISPMWSDQTGDAKQMIH